MRIQLHDSPLLSIPLYSLTLPQFGRVCNRLFTRCGRGRACPALACGAVERLWKGGGPHMCGPYMASCRLTCSRCCTALRTSRRSPLRAATRPWPPRRCSIPRGVKPSPASGKCCKIFSNQLVVIARVEHAAVRDVNFAVPPPHNDPLLHQAGQDAGDAGFVTPMACASASGETSVLCCARWWMASR